MAKRAKSCPAWLATFADLMSLLMAVFVLLFAMSTIEKPKYVAAVESLSGALNPDAQMSLEQQQYLDEVKAALEAEKIAKTSALEVVKEVTVESLRPLYERLLETFSDDAQSSDIKIQFDERNNQIKFVFQEQIAFDPGSADLKPQFMASLSRFYGVKDEKVSVQVIGHTDKRPISGGAFESNWALSSARASSVIVQLLEDGSIRPGQAQAIGLADTMPVSLGDASEDLAKNRRVEILIAPETLRVNP